LIGHTHQFFKNFKFCYNYQNSQTSDDLIKIRRIFEIVEIFGGISTKMENKFFVPSVLEFLKKIGADILKIKFNSLTFSKSDFLGVMKALQETRELEMNGIRFKETGPDQGIYDFKLKHLTKLEISGSTNLKNVFGFVPASLKTLKVKNMWEEEHWDPELLGKQKSLEELSFDFCNIEKFQKFDPENCHIRKLEIDFIKILNDRAFEKFSDFLKIQESVTEFKLFLSYRELMESNHDYTGVLNHLLSLKSLEKFSLECNEDEEILEVFSRLMVSNPAVDTLIIQNPTCLCPDLTALPKLFPSITDLKITWPNVGSYELYNFYVDLEPINSMKMIRKLEIDYVSDEMLAQLDLKELREFYLTKIVSTVDGRVCDDDFLDHLGSWTKFIESHTQLEVLHVSHCCLGADLLLIALENLPSLKSLEFLVYERDFNYYSDDPEDLSDPYEKRLAENIARLIGENYDRFEHLKLNLFGDSIRRCVLNYLEKHYPGVN
jgi:hypothetical protein